MKNIVTYSFCESFIDNFVKYIDENYLKQGRDISRIAVVFGGKRPSLFVKRELAEKINKSFYPPRFFTIDEFVGYVVSKKHKFEKDNDLDQCYLIYNLAKKAAPGILKGRETFSQFLPWTREILSFIDQLDLENIKDDDLKHIQDNAEIGYSVPDDINHLLESIVSLRKKYHEHMIESKVYSRGFQYNLASQVIDSCDFALRGEGLGK